MAHFGSWRNTTQKWRSPSPSFLPSGSRGSCWWSWLPWCSRGQGTCPTPFPMFLRTAPWTVPPSLLRGVSHPTHCCSPGGKEGPCISQPPAGGDSKQAGYRAGRTGPAQDCGRQETMARLWRSGRDRRPGPEGKKAKLSKPYTPEGAGGWAGGQGCRRGLLLRLGGSASPAGLAECFRGLMGVVRGWWVQGKAPMALGGPWCTRCAHSLGILSGDE